MSVREIIERESLSADIAQYGRVVVAMDTYQIDGASEKLIAHEIWSAVF